MSGYRTIKERSQDEFVVKKSRFIGYVCPVKTVEEANAFIEEIKKKQAEAMRICQTKVLAHELEMKLIEDIGLGTRKTTKRKNERY